MSSLLVCGLAVLRWRYSSDLAWYLARAVPLMLRQVFIAARLVASHRRASAHNVSCPQPGAAAVQWLATALTAAPLQQPWSALKRERSQPSSLLRTELLQQPWSAFAQKKG